MKIGTAVKFDKDTLLNNSSGEFAAFWMMHMNTLINALARGMIEDNIVQQVQEEMSQNPDFAGIKVKINLESY